MLFTNHTRYRMVSKFFWHWNDVIVIVGDNVYFAIQMWFLRNVGEVVIPTLWE